MNEADISSINPSSESMRIKGQTQPYRQQVDA